MRIQSSILDASGLPMRRMGSRPYGAADYTSQELQSWTPTIGSADSDYLNDRDAIVSRARDLVRNSGWASSAISKHLDNVIGSGFRLSAKPDYRALGLDSAWARDFAQEIEGRWRLYAEDQDNWIDATRHHNFNGLLGLAFRHNLTDGEAVALALWLEDKPSGKAKTTIQMVDPDRLSNPDNAFDREYLRGGIELNQYGAAIAYHFRCAHPADWYGTAKSHEWVRVERETAWGRRLVIHAYDKERTDQTKGIGILTPVIERFKMIDKYDRVELQAALLNATYAAFIESPFDHELLAEVLEGENNSLLKYQSQRQEFHSNRGITVQGIRIPTLFPGEKLNMQQATRPAYQFADFEKACLRNIAAGIGMSYEQLTQDWTSTNYSSARAALMEVWKFMSRTRNRFADQFATPIFMLWLEEQIVDGAIKLPRNAPDFYTGKPAYARCKWIGQGRGWVDPVKEAQASQMRMDSAISTLEDECSDQGKDWEEVLIQRKRELDKCDELGIPRPMWANQQIAYVAQPAEEN